MSINIWHGHCCINSTCPKGGILQANYVDILDINALATQDARSGNRRGVGYVEWGLINGFHEKEFSLPSPSQCWEMKARVNIFLCKTIQHAASYKRSLDRWWSVCWQRRCVPTCPQLRTHLRWIIVKSRSIWESWDRYLKFSCRFKNWQAFRQLRLSNFNAI